MTGERGFPKPTRTGSVLPDQTIGHEVTQPGFIDLTQNDESDVEIRSTPSDGTIRENDDINNTNRWTNSQLADWDRASFSSGIQPGSTDHRQDFPRHTEPQSAPSDRLDALNQRLGELCGLITESNNRLQTQHEHFINTLTAQHQEFLDIFNNFHHRIDYLKHFFYDTCSTVNETASRTSQDIRHDFQERHLLVN